MKEASRAQKKKIIPILDEVAPMNEKQMNASAVALCQFLAAFIVCGRTVVTGDGGVSLGRAASDFSFYFIFRGRSRSFHE